MLERLLYRQGSVVVISVRLLLLLILVLTLLLLILLLLHQLLLSLMYLLLLGLLSLQTQLLSRKVVWSGGSRGGSNGLQPVRLLLLLWVLLRHVLLRML